jgi:hypothetical protein
VQRGGHVGQVKAAAHRFAQVTELLKVHGLLCTGVGFLAVNAGDSESTSSKQERLLSHVLMLKTDMQCLAAGCMSAKLL